ncbi:RDD family protein [Microbacterium sp.]|mgnify:CR=1 FL=1|uniref:RDD family protein n=1 Tax=Microbacterium sp. TaxID=51671 RepID=UPI000AD3126C|nr:RDD family protein [Microbacterium sp.]
MSAVQSGRPGVPAAIGRRVGAYVIDGAIGCGVVAVLGGVGAAVLQAVLRPGDERALALLILWVNLVVLLAGLAWSLVYTAMQGGRGSLGQRALGLRLADQADGGAIGFWRALLRNVVWGLACSIVVGYFTPLFDGSGRRQGWHDLVARAVVIDARATDAATAVPAPPRPATANPYLPPPAGAVASAPPLPAAPPASFAPAGVAPTGPAPTAPATPAAAASASAAPSATAASSPAARTGGPVYAPPASVAPAVAIPTGMISEVPGISAPAAPAAASSPPPSSVAATPAAPASVAATPVAPPAPPAPRVDAPAPPEDLDETRAAASVVPPVAVLVWDNGTRVAVYGRTLFGRNPAREHDATAVAVRDETLSLSKTHFEMGGEATGAWVVDRHSTNGVVLVRDGGRITLVAGERTAVRTGDRLEFGDRSATIEGVA